MMKSCGVVFVGLLSAACGLNPSQSSGIAQPEAPDRQGAAAALFGEGAGGVTASGQRGEAPSLLATEGGYHAYALDPAGTKLLHTYSADGVRWQARPAALAKLPQWASRLQGSPAVVPSAVASDGYLLYFLASQQPEGPLCLGVATSLSPAGPFESAASEPLLCPEAVTAQTVVASCTDRTSHRRYLQWQTDAKRGTLPLSEDGLQSLRSPLGAKVAPGLVAED